MGNQPTKGGKTSKLGQAGASTHAKSTTGVDFQKSLRNYQNAQSEYQYLSTITHFDENTLRLLHARFTVIDQAMQEDGYISVEEFAQILAMPSESLLLKRFFKFMDKSDMGTLNFRNFVDTMSKLSIDASLEDKVDLSFFLYDINQDGYIDRTECKQMVQAALEQIEMPLSDKQIEQMVENTFNVTDTNNDNLIDKEEYTEYCKKNPRILQSFQVDISNLIRDEHENKKYNHRYSSSMEKIRHLHHGPNHSPNTDSKFFGKYKIKKPKMRVKNKVERVKTIHTADQIMAGGTDDGENWTDDSQDDGNVQITKSNTMKHNNEISHESGVSDELDPSSLFRKAKSADITKLQTIQQYPSENTLSSTANFLAKHPNNDTPTVSQSIGADDETESDSSLEEKFDASNNTNNSNNNSNNNSINNRTETNSTNESKDSSNSGVSGTDGKENKKLRRSKSPWRSRDKSSKKEKKERKRNKSKSRDKRRSKSPSNSPDNDKLTRQSSQHNSLTLSNAKNLRRTKSKPS